MQTCEIGEMFPCTPYITDGKLSLKDMYRLLSPEPDMIGYGARGFSSTLPHALVWPDFFNRKAGENKMFGCHHLDKKEHTTVNVHEHCMWSLHPRS